jgi:hypothetical protein
MLAAVIFSNNPITFWDWMFFFFIWIPAVCLWIFCLFDIFTNRQWSGGARFLWVLFILLIPWIGALVYLIARKPDDVVYDRT